MLIAEDVEGEALAMLVLNKLRGAFNTPSPSKHRRLVIAVKRHCKTSVLTGATVISEDLGLTFENADLRVIGKTRKVLVSKDATTIIEGGGR